MNKIKIRNKQTGKTWVASERALLGVLREMGHDTTRDGGASLILVRGKWCLWKYSKAEPMEYDDVPTCLWGEVYEVILPKIKDTKPKAL